MLSPRLAISYSVLVSVRRHVRTSTIVVTYEQ
jgi:hypothetical protein